MKLKLTFPIVAVLLLAGCGVFQTADAPYKSANRQRLQTVQPWLNTYATDHPASKANVDAVVNSWRTEVEAQGGGIVNPATLPAK